MNIKCPECGNDNQLGAIFCRNCGAKLDIEHMRPTVKDNKVGGGFAGLAQRLLTILILIVVLGILAALFIPTGLKPYVAATEDEVKAATAKFDALMLKADGARGPAKHVFSPAELTAIANNLMLQKGAPQDSAAGYQVDDILIDITSAGELVIGIDTKLYGKVPARFELVGKPTTAEGEAGAAPVIGFDIVSASMGHVTMPVDLLKAKLAEKFAALAQGKDIEKILKSIKGIEIDSEGNLSISFPEVAKAAASAAKK